MKKTKLINLLIFLTLDEVILWEGFICSNLYIKEKNVQKLCRYITLYLKKGRGIEKEKAFSFVYPHENFNQRKFSYLQSKLFDFTKFFLVVYKKGIENIITESDILEYFHLMNLNKLYESEEKKIEKQFSINNKTSSSKFLRNFLFNKERQAYYVKSSRTKPTYLNSMNKSLDNFYFIEKLKTACAIINVQTIFKIKIEDFFIEPIIDWIESKDLVTSNSLLAIYYYVYKLLKSDPELHLLITLQKLLDSYKFEAQDIRNAYFFALNFCIRQLNNGNKAYNSKLYELYMIGIKQKLIFENNKLSPFAYSNIVTVGIRLKKYKETFKFIEDYKNYILGNDKKAYYSFNLSKYYFQLKEFTKVVDLFQDISIKEAILNIQIRIMECKAFYELGEYDLCIYLATNISQHLNRKDILAYHKNTFKNFLKIFKKLLKINKYKPNELVKLNALIDNTNPLLEIDWLKEKIGGIS